MAFGENLDGILTAQDRADIETVQRALDGVRQRLAQGAFKLSTKRAGLDVLGDAEVSLNDVVDYFDDLQTALTPPDGAPSERVGVRESGDRILTEVWKKFKSDKREVGLSDEI